MGSSIQKCPVLWKPTEKYVRWSDEHEQIMLNKKELTNAMSGGFRSWIQSWKSFTQDVQQNPEIYAHRIRENLDRDCAHVHAIWIRGETTGTRYVPRKAVDIVNNLPSWAPNWARGNRVLKAGATVFDCLPSTEPRATRSYDRRGRQVGMTYRVNMGKDNHNGRYRHWRFPVITAHALPNDSSLNVAQPITQYVQRYGGNTRYVLEVARKYTHTIWPRQNLRHWEVEVVLLSLKRAPNFLAVKHFWAFAVLNERKRCNLYLKKRPEAPTIWGRTTESSPSSNSWQRSRLLENFGVSQYEIQVASRDCKGDASKVADSFLRFRRKGVLMAGYVKQLDAEYENGFWGTIGYTKNITKWFCVSKEGYLMRFHRIHEKKCNLAIDLKRCRILRVSDVKFMIEHQEGRYVFQVSDSKTCLKWCRAISYKIYRLRREQAKKFGGECWFPPRVMRHIYAALRGY